MCRDWSSDLPWKTIPLLHPGRLTWNLQITRLERQMFFQTSMIMFHVNLQGCNPPRFHITGSGCVFFGVDYLIFSMGFITTENITMSYPDTHCSCYIYLHLLNFMVDVGKYIPAPLSVTYRNICGFRSLFFQPSWSRKNLRCNWKTPKTDLNRRGLFW